MLTALMAFALSAAGRIAIGKLFDLVERWMDHKTELARMHAQGQLDALAHGRLMESIRLQHDLGVREIRVMAEATRQAVEDSMLFETVKQIGRKSGNKVIDAWNHGIRPFLASVAIAVWLFDVFHRGGSLNEFDKALMSSVLGLFVGGRIHATGR